MLIFSSFLQHLSLFISEKEEVFWHFSIVDYFSHMHSTVNMYFDTYDKTYPH